MPQNVNDSDTQVEDLELENQDGNTNENQDEEYFLTVDDRTRYRTPEEAQAAYQQAGQRISQLAPWEQRAGQYGITDPQQLDEVIEELEELRQFKANAGKTQKSTGGDNSTQNDDEEPLTEEEKKAQKWLEKNAKKLGYLKASDIEEFKQQLEELKGSAEQTEEERFNEVRENRITTGRGVLKGLLEADKLPTDPKVSGFIENALASWINGLGMDFNSPRIKAFYQGGDALEQLIKEGYEEVKSALNIVRGQSQQKYANDKQNSQQRNGRPLPRPGVAVKGKTNSNRNSQQNDAKPKRQDFTPDVHNKAWEVLQRKLGNNSEE